MANRRIEWQVALLGATLPILILLLSLHSVWPDISNYEGVFQTNGLDHSSNVDITARLFDWFGQPMASGLDITEFDAMESSHLRDVKLVLKVGYAIFYALIFVWFIAFVFDRRLFWRSALAGGIAGLLLCVVLAAVPFDSLFVGFHGLVFPQGNWLFPRGGFMVTLYPERLFEHLGFLIFIRFLAMLLFACALGWLFSRDRRPVA